MRFHIICEAHFFVLRIDMFRLFLLFSMFFATAASAQDGTLYTDSTTRSTVITEGTTTINSPPPSAIAPSINSSNSDICTIGVSGAVQTQILGLAAGATVRDLNCERLKNAKTLYDMGMKVAAVSVMCEDERVFEAMMHAGTPWPYNGQIGEAARLGWETDTGENRITRNGSREGISDDDKSTIIGSGLIGGLLLLLLL